MCCGHQNPPIPSMVKNTITFMIKSDNRPVYLTRSCLLFLPTHLRRQIQFPFSYLEAIVTVNKMMNMSLLPVLDTTTKAFFLHKQRK